MISKPFSAPSKTGGDGLAYLLKKEGREIAPEVVQGDPDSFREIVQGIEFKQKYYIGVLSFEELLEPWQEKAIIKDYEDTFFAGLDETAIARVWVKHTEHGRTELHPIVAEQHLITGQKYTHYLDRLDRDLNDNWQEKINAEYDLSSPHDPRNRRFRDRPKYKSDEKVFRALDDIVCEAFERGVVETREEVAELLRQEPKILEVKENKSYLALKIEGREQPLRLKGKKYERGFDLQQFIEENERESRAFRINASERYREHQGKLSEALERRRERQSRKFGPAQERAKSIALENMALNAPERHNRELDYDRDSSSRQIENNEFSHQRDGISGRTAPITDYENPEREGRDFGDLERSHFSVRGEALRDLPKWSRYSDRQSEERIRQDQETSRTQTHTTGGVENGTGIFRLFERVRAIQRDLEKRARDAFNKLGELARKLQSISYPSPFGQGLREELCGAIDKQSARTGEQVKELDRASGKLREPAKADRSERQRNIEHLGYPGSIERMRRNLEVMKLERERERQQQIRQRGRGFGYGGRG